MSLLMDHPRGCTTVPEADLRKAFSALLMCQKEGADCSKQRDGVELEQSEFCSIHGPVKELLHIQEGPAAGLTHLPGAQEATCHEQRDATCECAVRKDVENGICSRDGSVRETLDPQGTSAPGHVHRNILRRLPGEWFSCHPVLTSALIVLLVLVLALAVALAVQSAPQLPVPPATPPLVLGCPSGWVGYNGACYYLSRDSRSWEQSQERCSEPGRAWGTGAQRVPLASSAVSAPPCRVPVLGNSECLCLADDKFRSVMCSNPQPYLCSKARAPL
ncbi:LOW QUALITY PROTEIN: uncharacterized protein M8220_005659 [Acridotheres tristis]